MTTAERFWSKVVRLVPDDCWEWRGNRSSWGYGRFHLDRRTRVAAHRVAWELTRGPIPDGWRQRAAAHEAQHD